MFQNLVIDLHNMFKVNESLSNYDYVSNCEEIYKSALDLIKNHGFFKVEGFRWDIEYLTNGWQNNKTV